MKYIIQIYSLVSSLYYFGCYDFLNFLNEPRGFVLTPNSADCSKIL
jgi:hypothetical protein